MSENEQHWLTFWQDFGRKLPKQWTKKSLFFDPDNYLALKHICIEEEWNVSQIFNYLLEGFLNDYKRIFPDSGYFQTQLTAFKNGEMSLGRIPARSSNSEDDYNSSRYRIVRHLMAQFREQTPRNRISLGKQIRREVVRLKKSAPINSELEKKLEHVFQLIRQMEKK